MLLPYLIYQTTTGGPRNKCTGTAELGMQLFIYSDVVLDTT